MLEAAAFFLGSVAVSAFLARDAPWKVAQYRFRSLESLGFDPAVYDPDRIRRQVRGRTLTTGWLAATLVGSSFIGAFAFLMPTYIAVYLCLAGVTIISGYAFWQAVRLFNIGVTELGMKWPPYDESAYQIGEARFDTRNPEDR